MPYIKKTMRALLNCYIETLKNHIIHEEPIIFNRPGVVNYAITRLVAGSLKPVDGWSYHSLSRAIAVLRDAATEMERRLMAKREDKAIQDNGDIQEYE